MLVAPPHHYLFNGELVLLVHFSVYFARLPVGGRADVTGHVLKFVTPKSPGVAYPVVSKHLHHYHRMCF